MRLDTTKPVSLLFCLLIALVGEALADTEVKDGDDMIIDGQDTRFFGADAFERGKTCEDDKGQDYDCGERARVELAKIIGGQQAQCGPMRLRW